MNRQISTSHMLAAALLMVMSFGAESAMAQLQNTQQANIAESSIFDNGLRIGASINYGGPFFDSEFSQTNDFFTNSTGFGLQALYGFSLNSMFSVSSGITFFVNRYSSDEDFSPFTNEAGEPLGTGAITSMEGTAATAYAGVPVNLVVRPLPNKSFYAVLGPEIGFRIAHKNDMIVSRIDPIPEEGDPFGDENGIISSTEYKNPELSRKTILFINAGLGYSLPSASLPLDFSLGIKQSLVTYVDREDYINSWLRHATLSVSYRF